MNKVFQLLILSFLLAVNVFAQDTISYHLSFPNAIHHEAEVTIELNNIKSISVNSMYRSIMGRNILSKAAREWKHDANVQIRGQYSIYNTIDHI